MSTLREALDAYRANPVDASLDQLLKECENALVMSDPADDEWRKAEAWHKAWHAEYGGGCMPGHENAIRDLMRAAVITQYPRGSAHQHRFDVVIRDDAHMRLLGCSNTPCEETYQWDW